MQRGRRITVCTMTEGALSKGSNARRRRSRDKVKYLFLLAAVAVVEGVPGDTKYPFRPSDASALRLLQQSVRQAGHWWLNQDGPHR